MNNKKYLIYAVIFLAVAAGIFIYVTQRGDTTPEITNTNEVVEPTPVPTPTPTPEAITNAKIFTDAENGYSFSYPQDLYKPYGISISLPYGDRSLLAPRASFKHEINVEYCALSGQCQPTTIDMSFGAVVVPDSLNKILADHPEFKLMEVQRATMKTLEYSEGAEGEGMNYYFFSLPNGKTLILYQRNISEQVVTKYQTVPEFMKFEDQMKTMDKILASLKIN